MPIVHRLPMRWSAFVMMCVLAAAAAAGATSPVTTRVMRRERAARQTRGVSYTDRANDTGILMDEQVFAVSAVSFKEGVESGLALAALVRAALAARGVAARAVPPPAACRAPDAGACLRGTLAALARGALHAALVPAARAPAPPALRDAGLEELGDAAPPARRACVALPHAPRPHVPPPRSLLDFADDQLAALYHLTEADIDGALRTLSVDDRLSRYTCNEMYPSLSADDEKSYATLLTSDEGEAALMREVINAHGLRVRVACLGAAAVPPARLLAALAPRALLLCGRGLDLTALAPLHAYALGPPPCLFADCPFEARRLLKLVNARELARSPSAMRTLGRLALDDAELRTLEQRAREAGPEAAAHEALAAHPEWAGAAAEVRVAVMIPATTRREVLDASALRAAAELAEDDVEREAGERRAFDFKVELLDDACSGPRAFKYLTDALGSEFGALSGVAGPACGAAFGDVMRQSVGLTLPVVAYTAQAPPARAAEGAWLALLAAGDARHETAAVAALLTRMRWRRVAVLSELATRAALDPARLAADVLVHVELPADGEDLDEDLISQWATRVAAVNGRIVYVRVEESRSARAALCAARRARLLPAAGVVFLLPAALPPLWLRPRAADSHNCTRAQLEEAAEGHLSVAWEWAARWRPPAAWAARWAERCRRAATATDAADAACREPPPHAALLYDALRLWNAALVRLLSDHPSAVDDLHRDDLVRSLVENAVKTPYSGLTGAFEWESAGSGHARGAALVVRQWRAGAYVPVGSWRRGVLALDAAALRWRTAGGLPPDDGAERCALQALADALHADCRVAFAALAALLLAALVALLAAGAWHCRRRAERDFRARLAALGMRTLVKPSGPDRWEVPRERVVINRKLGTGAFGTVYGGHALLAEDRGWSAVAVKTLKAGATVEEKLDFLSEAEAMKRFDHKNVVRLLGVVTETEPVCTVMEFMLYGDLKNYLLARRQLAGASGAAGEEVSPTRLTSMALDVARALSYLAQLHYVHRDVAARNCLVSAHRVVKLADFGMTRLVYEHDYYRFSRKGMLPVRWMAPESLALGVFSPASDVWSFGVLLYEIVTFGSLPYQGLSNAEVLARVKAGHTLDLPPGLKPQLESLIKSCWRAEGRTRPRAAALAAALGDAPRLLAPALDVPLGALPLHAGHELGDAAQRDVAQARWVSWAAPTSAGTDSTYLSADAAPRESDAFLPHEHDHAPP